MVTVKGLNNIKFRRQLISDIRLNRTVRWKRVMDVIFALIILIIFSPVWIFTGILIKLTSRGPILYRQERVGLKEKEFTIYKFRSMIDNAEKLTGPVLVKENDNRVTKIGKIIRKLRIDEVPQFINVLVGDMSFVGPRPERPFFVEKFKSKIPLYEKRFLVKPGITGWAQINQSYEKSIEDVKKKLEYDLFYIENMSLFMDLKIILKTICIIFSGKGK